MFMFHVAKNSCIYFIVCFMFKNKFNGIQLTPARCLMIHAYAYHRKLHPMPHRCKISKKKKHNVYNCSIPQCVQGDHLFIFFFNLQPCCVIIFSCVMLFFFLLFSRFSPCINASGFCTLDIVHGRLEKKMIHHSLVIIHYTRHLLQHISQKKSI